MSLWVARVTVASIVLAALQVTVFSSLRVASVVIMIIWLFTLIVGLHGGTPPALVAGFVTGALFDAHVSTPFGLFTAVGLLVGFVAGQLGREGIGDFKAAVWWMPAVIGAGFGFFAPVVVVLGGMLVGNFSLWHGDLGGSMVVNAAAFALLIQPFALMVRRLVGEVEGYRW